MSIIKNLQWRYATELFDTNKEISDDDLKIILEAGNLAATAYGLQPFQFIVIKDQAKRDSLIECSYGQKHVAKNSVLIVIAARTDVDETYIEEYTTRIEKTRNLANDALKGFKEMMVNDLTNRTPEARLVWAQKQSYIALGTLMVASSELQIDNHAFEGFDSQKVDSVLGLNKYNLTSTTLLALGYRQNDDPKQHYKKVRKSINDIVIWM